MDQLGKIGFVLLNYNGYDITCRCIESILQLEQQERIKILIVDNHSTDESGLLLLEKYKEKKVEVLLLDENFGFSKANNLGYKKLMNEDNYEFIVIANNDILFVQKDFVARLERYYQEEEFFVGGPDVYGVYKKEHQSPIALYPKTKEQAEKIVRDAQHLIRVRLWDYCLYWVLQLVKNTYIYRAYKEKQNEKKDIKTDWMESHDNAVLHGSCLFFSKKFMELNEFVFTPGPFFYFEEDFLTSRCLENNWKTRYLPEMKVEHMEGESTKHNGYLKRLKFRCGNLVRSGKMYLEYLENAEKRG